MKIYRIALNEFKKLFETTEDEHVIDFYLYGHSGEGPDESDWHKMITKLGLNNDQIVASTASADQDGYDVSVLIKGNVPKKAIRYLSTTTPPEFRNNEWFSPWPDGYDGGIVAPIVQKKTEKLSKYDIMMRQREPLLRDVGDRVVKASREQQEKLIKILHLKMSSEDSQSRYMIWATLEDYINNSEISKLKEIDKIMKKLGF